MRYVKKNLGHGDTDSVDDTVGDGNISWVVRVLSEGLFSDDDIVDEILSEGTLVGKWLSSNVGEVGGSDGGGGNLTLHDVGTAAVSIESSEVLFVSLDGGVDRGEDGVLSAGDFSGNTGGLKAGDEKVEVVVSLKVRLFESLFDTISSPNLSRSLKGGKDINSTSRSGGGRGSSDRSGGGGSSRSRGGGGRSGSSIGTGVTHLQVFLEGRGNRDTLARILVVKGIRITGISHTSGSKGRSVEKSGGDSSLRGRGEGRSTSDEGSDKGNFALNFDRLEGKEIL